MIAYDVVPAVRHPQVRPSKLAGMTPGIKARKSCKNREAHSNGVKRFSAGKSTWLYRVAMIRAGPSL
jgi:hypothetical protein